MAEAKKKDGEPEEAVELAPPLPPKPELVEWAETEAEKEAESG